ncbi:MAG TPA: MFS transporter [Acidimicrobiia bacterium]|nr:MFS transporter [Acidimicrobiia bacterium]
MPARSLAPFRHRTFAMFWTGAFVSNIGTWMETVAIGAYVTDLTGRAAWTGAVAAAGFVPIAVLSPVGGALADRLPRKAVLLTTTFVQLALAALLTVLFVLGEPSAPIVTLVVFGSGIASSIGFPAYQALLPDLVPAEDLPGAIGLSSAQWNLGRVIGPALAGIVIYYGSYAWALGVNAVSFLAVVAVLLTLTLPRPERPPDGEGLFASIRDGVRFVRREPGLRAMVTVMCVNTLLAAPFIALVPAMAIKVLDAGNAGVSVLVTAQGIGAVAMGVALGGLTATHGSRRVLMRALWCLPVALVAYAYAPNLALSALGLVFVGALYLAAFSTFTTIAQTRAPTRLRGRVLSVNMVVLGVLYPVGSLIQGRLADAIGLRLTTALAGVVMAATLFVMRVLRPDAADALDAPLAAELQAVASAAVRPHEEPEPA